MWALFGAAVAALGLAIAAGSSRRERARAFDEGGKAKEKAAADDAKLKADRQAEIDKAVATERAKMLAARRRERDREPEPEDPS